MVLRIHRKRLNKTVLTEGLVKGSVAIRKVSAHKRREPVDKVQRSNPSQTGSTLKATRPSPEMVMVSSLLTPTEDGVEDGNHLAAHDLKARKLNPARTLLPPA